MPQSVILFWRDIPTQVIAKAGRVAAKRQLSARFLEAVDAAAMRAGAKSADDYLSDWRRGPPEPCGEDLEAEAQRLAALLESEFDSARLGDLVRREGRA